TKISPLPNPPTPTPTPSSAKGPKRSFPTTPTSSIVNAPNFDAHVITYQLWDLAPAVHHVFYTRHLGLTPAIAEQIAQVKDFPQKFPSSLNNLAATKYLQGLKALHEVLNDYANHLSGRAIYQFVPAYAAGDDVVLGERTREGAGKEEKETQNILHFTRQQIAPYHCLSDWVWPQSSSDQIALFIVTVGQNLRRIVHQLKEQGEFLKSHLLAAYALESAEALAHLVHQQVRNLWQIAPTQGQRYSFGHASCPNLDNQQVLFNILHPEQIGVTLTEAMMMEPEASVSGIILAHPEACYFDALAKS
ncbi:MAG: hypothetical protein J6Y94_06840, partial [Bacteriovoracaceae bacterium]|nr:hypothetical protein [Bacteriovoracaceae bacterium]